MRKCSAPRPATMWTAQAEWSIIDDNPNELVMEVRRFLYSKQNQNKLI